MDLESAESGKPGDGLPACYGRPETCKNGRESPPADPEEPSRRRDPNTWKLSRWSRLGWGCHAADVLPCVPTRCPYRESQRCDDFAPGAGRPCRIELLEARRLAEAYDRQFARARIVLGEATYYPSIKELVILQLRIARINQRNDWMLLHLDEAKRDPDWWNRQWELTSKYHTTTLNKWGQAIARLKEASADPLLGWTDFERTQYIMSGIGPACDIKTREHTLEHLRK